MDEENFRKYIDDFFNDLVLYDDFHNNHRYKDLLKAGIEVFLDNENHYNAYEIYQTFFMIYQITFENKSEGLNPDLSLVSEKNTLLDLVEIMKNYEENTGDLIEKQRDHFVHSVNVFLLGLAIYSQSKEYRETFEAYVLESPYEKFYKNGEGNFSHEEFLYRWGVASLFHDIGYPVEIIGKQLNKFINDSVKSISYTYNADTAIDFKDFDDFNAIVKKNPNFADNYTKHYPQTKFLNLFKPTDIMAHKISIDFPDVDINQVIDHLDSFVDIMRENGFIDHGFFSAILVLNSYGYLIQKYVKNNDFFFYPIVDSATAILLHNYYRNVLQKKPFNLPAMHPRKSPIAFLLILCDELQEWNRKPLGIMDRKRDHANEFHIEIKDSRLEVEYIVHNGSLGLGFGEDKEELLRNLLSISSIFERGLTILSRVKQDNVIKEIEKSEKIPVPDILMRNVELLALKTHQQYIDTTIRQYEEQLAKGEVSDDIRETYLNLKPFDELTPQLKIANIRQARSIPDKLNIIGCEMVSKNDEREEITEFTEDEVMELAICEHDEWCEEKIGTGWMYGEDKDIDNLVTPYLVPWEELEPEIQQYDIDPVLNIPELVQSLGLKIVRTRIRLLTFEMHKFYSNENKTVAFDDLPDYIKFSNYRQTEFLVKILSEIGFELVDKNKPGSPVTSFDDDSLEYLAHREHMGWYRLRVDSGWKYGPVRDEKLKINPYLVKWEDLDVSRKELNKKTFKHLPQLCDNVGLKIIRS